MVEKLKSFHENVKKNGKIKSFGDFPAADRCGEGKWEGNLSENVHM
jgi:hypothetical protein